MKVAAHDAGDTSPQKSPPDAIAIVPSPDAVPDTARQLSPDGLGPPDALVVAGGDADAINSTPDLPVSRDLPLADHYDRDLPASPDLIEIIIKLDAPPPSTPDVASLPLPKDVTVYANKDFAPADTACVSSTSVWLSKVAYFLAEDQKCWADDDCMYVGFGDQCGTICVLPMNKQRVGEFGGQIYSYATANCTTCPSPTNIPTCAPPTTVICNAGRCEYKKN